MSTDTLPIGHRHSFTYRVPADKTVPHIYRESKEFADFPEVFATGFLVALMEWVCIQVLHPTLEDGQGSLGIAMDMTHTAPTPVGFDVVVEVELTEHNGRTYVWDVVAHDGVSEIGRGKHTRAVIDRAKFDARLATKAEKRPM